MPRKASGAFAEFWEIVKTLLWAGVIAIVIRTFAYEPFNIPSSSMVPTLLVGDYLFVSKFSYGYSKYSFPGGIVPVEGRIWEGAPTRGEVVVFRPPGEVETDFIKRVVGVPGDSVQVRQGILYINDVAVQRQRIEDYVDPEVPSMVIPQYLETLPGGVTHRIIETQGDLGRLDDTPTFVVPPDHYFMMGDNRDNSSDSREGISGDPKCKVTINESNRDCMGKVGFVPKENLVGPAKILFWSYVPSVKWYNPVTWVTALRYERLLNVIE